MARKKSKARGIIISIVLLAGAALVAYSLFFKERGPEGIAVSVENVSRRTITQTVAATGKIRPESEVKVSPETSGEIVYLGVDEGDTVHPGKLLIRIKPDLVETQLEQNKAAVEAARARAEAAKAEFTLAKSSLERTTALRERDVATQDELEQAQSRLDQALSNFQAAQEEINRTLATMKQTEASAERTSIFSPASGIITALTVDVGETVVGTAQQAGTIMMRVSDLSVMNAVVEVDENDVVLINIKDTADIFVDAFPDTTFPGVVHKIGNSAKASGLGTQQEVVNFEVEIRLLEVHPRFRPGMSCSAEIRTETRYDVLSVPLQSVTLKRLDAAEGRDTMQAGVPKPAAANRTMAEPVPVVFTVEENTAVVSEVQTGISDKGYIEITGGLDENASVVKGSFRAITKELEDGSQVVVDTLRGGTSKRPSRP